ncbi:MAG: M20/M25/M40 family metallo-hydrolase [Candidatus Mycalebacterium zealandia]|nr:MAG: M20/M25/M40 family metallo-hydrolase [Candidatus Mycalebacterium zealandia]
MMISYERMSDHLMSIIRIDSESRFEKDVALVLEKEMKEIGGECFYDDCGEKVGGNTGNLIVKIKGNTDAPPFFLCSHMDTVAPGKGIKPSIKDGIMRSDGTTILGSDDKSGVSIIVEVVRSLKERDLPHGDIEIAFMICEEVGLLGAKFIDCSVFESSYGIVLDSSTPDRLVLKCPASDRIKVKITGVEAHAGLCPEDGVSAIEIASKAIAKMNLGRIDSETTANIGTISGGSAINIVPGETEVIGEARSHNTEKLAVQMDHMRKCFEKASTEVCGDTSAVQIEQEHIYFPMDVPPSSEIAKMVEETANNLGHPVALHTSGGGCDANYINGKGIQCVNLGTGMYDLHTVDEHLVIEEFNRSADIVLRTIMKNAGHQN